MFIESIVVTIASALAQAGATAQQTAAPIEDTSTLTHTVVVSAPVDEVWAAFTTKDGVESWMVPLAAIDLRDGGALRTHYDPNGTIGDANTIENTYLAIVPQRLLAFRCTKAPEGVWFKDLIADTWSIVTFEELAARSTRVTIVGVGYTDDPDSQRMREFFQSGNQQVMDALAAHFTDSASAANDDRILDLLGDLEGEWTVHNVRDDGTVFRVRNTYELGPDGRSIVARGWLGDAETMHPHGAIQVFREPNGGGVRFQSVNENGAIARGPIALEGEDILLWQWDVTTLDGLEGHYVVRQTIASESSYTFQLFEKQESGELVERVNVEFARAADE